MSIAKSDDYRLDEASPTGGLLFSDPKEGEMLRRSLQYLAQRVGGQVLSGNVNFTKMSMPVHLNEPRSLLERLTDDWASASHYLPLAARTSDPVERIKHVTAFVVSGLHCMDTLGKPFNPILGSTYQATLDDGTPCFVEQTSHHPPVTHYTIQPQSGEYVFAGFSGIDGRVVWGLDTGLSSRRIGINVVEFADGTRIVYSLPRMLVRGLAAERKCEYLGPFSVFYEDHDLVFDVLLDPPQPFRWSPFAARTPSDYMDGVLYRLKRDEERGEVGKSGEYGEEGEEIEDGEDDKDDEGNAIVFTGAFKKRDGAFFGDPDAVRADADERGYIPVELRTDEQVKASVTSALQVRDNPDKAEDFMERDILSYARGTFLGYFDIDGQRCWDIRETPKAAPTPTLIDKALGSDCRHREDVIALRKAVEEQNNAKREELTHDAQTLKEKLENIQRNDRKLRAEGLETEEQSSDSNEKDGADDKTQKPGNEDPERTSNDQSQYAKSTTNDTLPFFPRSLGGL